MSTLEIILAVILLLGGCAAAYFYTRIQRAAETARLEKLTPEDRAALEESPVCDPIRATLSRLRAELAATPDFDPVRRGNISGQIALNQAELTECERVERRNRLR